MQLSQSKAFGVFNNHYGRFRHVDPDFNDGCGDEQAELSVFEPFHNLVFLFFFHFSVNQPDNIAENFMQGFQVDFFGLFDQRTDPVGPAALLQFAFQAGSDFVDFFNRDDPGINGFASGRNLVYFGIFHVSVSRQHQSPGNRRGGHDQNVGFIAFVGQAQPLVDAETVLFVDNNAGEVAEFDLFLKQGVGPD